MIPIASVLWSRVKLNDGALLLLTGPFDLAKQMQVQFGGEEHEAAIAKTLKAAKAAGKTAAIFCE